VTVLKTEVKAVVAVLEEADDVAARAADLGEDPPTIEYVATKIIEDLDDLRSKKSMASIIARFSAVYVQTWKLFLYGQYKSKDI